MGGSPRIEGRRIRVADVVELWRIEELTPEQVAATYAPPLTLAQVEAALEYYAAHCAEIDRSIEREDALIRDLVGRGVVERI